MKTIWLKLLEMVIKKLVGKELIFFVEKAVKTVANEDLSGDEKREKVITEAEKYFKETSNIIINLAIETMVFLFKEKIGETYAK